MGQPKPSRRPPRGQRNRGAPPGRSRGWERPGGPVCWKHPERGVQPNAVDPTHQPAAPDSKPDLRNEPGPGDQPGPEQEPASRTEPSPRQERGPRQEPGRAHGSRPGKPEKSAGRGDAKPRTKAANGHGVRSRATSDSAPRHTAADAPPRPTDSDARPTTAPATAALPVAAEAEPGGPAPGEPESAAGEAPGRDVPTSPAAAFDALYVRHAPALTRQAYLLTGRSQLAEEAVEYAFRLAWQQWPKVAVDRDPAGWVRAAVYEFALSPWHQFRPERKKPPRAPADSPTTSSATPTPAEGEPEKRGRSLAPRRLRPRLPRRRPVAAAPAAKDAPARAANQTSAHTTSEATEARPHAAEPSTDAGAHPGEPPVRTIRRRRWARGRGLTALRRAVRRAAIEAGPGTVPPSDPALLDALLSLPRSYRRTLLLYDGVGLDLPETAAETEASTPATAGRLMHARQALVERLPELRRVPRDRLGAALHQRLGALAVAQPVRVRAAQAVRSGSEGTTTLMVRASVGLTALIAAATALTLVTSAESDAPATGPTRPAATSPGPASSAPPSPSTSPSPDATSPTDVTTTKGTATTGPSGPTGPTGHP
ncbi:hypothetical protein [Streptomyces buecherae]|uniref:hypothetical protein n=1 Tax=Streptomyces buecherae TaxID=2763006 RepID=UPI0020B667EB|nr:hypothetical protein [Streptomyces buecherae]